MPDSPMPFSKRLLYYSITIILLLAIFELLSREGLTGRRIPAAGPFACSTWECEEKQLEDFPELPPDMRSDLYARALRTVRTHLSARQG